MKTPKIKSLLKTITGHLTNDADKIGRDFSSDDIHDFRVSYKKLRAFIRFLHAAGQQPSLKIHGDVKRLYHTAGLLRDAQLELDDIKGQQHSLHEYRQRLKSIIKKQNREWGKHYVRRSFKKLSNDIAHIGSVSFDTTGLGCFFDAKLTIISALAIKPSQTDNEIHQIRKEAKDILYVADAAGECWQNAKELQDILPVKQLKEIAEKIGDYHDEVVRIEHMSRFSSPALSLAERTTIEQMCSQKRSLLAGVKKEIMDIATGIATHTATTPALY